ncbi:uncharacterized protein O3C94_022492 isoform 2-T3 [Discoglossus pictus]
MSHYHQKRRFKRAARGEETKHEISAMVGSSVLIPGVNVTVVSDIIMELKRPGSNPDWLASYHGGVLLNGHYKNRGEYFYQNNSFFLRNVTEADSGVYVQEVNYEKMAEINLIVIASVKKPVLQRQDVHNKDCQVLVTCVGSGARRTNITILRNGEEIQDNVTRKENLTELSVYSKVPQSWGNYTCVVENPVSLETSDWIIMQYPVPPFELCSVFSGAVGAGLFILLTMYHAYLFSHWSKMGKQLTKVLFYTENAVEMICELAALISLQFISVPLIAGMGIFVVLFIIRVFCIVTESKNCELRTCALWIVNLTEYIIVPVICATVLIRFSVMDMNPCFRGIYEDYYLSFSISCTLGCLVIVFHLFSIWIYFKTKEWSPGSVSSTNNEENGEATEKMLRKGDPPIVAQPEDQAHNKNGSDHLESPEWAHDSVRSALNSGTTG